VHDTGPGTAERQFLNRVLPAVRHSDEPELVKHSHMLDDEEACGIPAAHRYAASKGRPGYGYGLACLVRDPAANYGLLRFRAGLAGFYRRFSKESAVNG
jgi:hypothetical protein